MNRSTLAAFTVVSASLLLLGFGCQTGETDTTFDTSTPTETTTKPADDGNSMSTTTIPTDSSDETITLTATPIGMGQVKLEWETNVPTTQIDGFRFIRSAQPNPEYDRKNYWWETINVRRETTWRDIVLGTYHMRACIVRNDECTVYSDDVVVDVR